METADQNARDFVARRFGERAQDLVPVGAAGEWSTAYFFKLDGIERVIRFGAHRDDYEKDRVMGAYASDTLPIPHVIEIGEAVDAFYAVSERLPGTPLDELSGPELVVVLPQLLDALFELQQLDLTGTKAVGLWRPTGAGPSWADELLSVAAHRDRLPGWRERLDGYPDEARVFDLGVERLRRLAPQLPEHRGLNHNDLLNRNVLVDAGKITGFIDWGNAWYGDPLYDLALLIYWWPWFPDWQGIDLHAIIARHWDRHGGPPTQMEARLRCCLIHLGLDHIAYNAFRQRPEHVKRNAAQLLTYITR